METQIPGKHRNRAGYGKSVADRASAWILLLESSCGERFNFKQDYSRLRSTWNSAANRNNRFLARALFPCGIHAGSAAETGLAAWLLFKAERLFRLPLWRTALASSNRFPLVIVSHRDVCTSFVPPFAVGSSLWKDLRIDNPVSHARRWRFFENPRLRQNHFQRRIRAVLSGGRSHAGDRDKQTCLIAVMKHHQHLTFHLVHCSSNGWSP